MSKSPMKPLLSGQPGNLLSKSRILNSPFLTSFIMATCLLLAIGGLSNLALTPLAPAFAISSPARSITTYDFNPLFSSAPIKETQNQEVKQQAAQAYGKLPISFEQNQGQFDHQVNFLARGKGYSLFLTQDEMALSLKKPVKKGEDPATDILHMAWLGANSAPRTQAVDLQESQTSYFVGNDSSKWHTNLPNYGKVIYSELYPG